jgi:Domain of Unknown Function (DUF928)
MHLLHRLSYCLKLKIRWQVLLSFLLISSFFIATLECSQAVNEKSIKLAKVKSAPATIPRKPRSLWQILLNSLKREEPPLASRGTICPILPGGLGSRNVIWSDLPIFAWGGQVNSLSIELRPYDLTKSYLSQPVIWRQSAMGKQQFVKYEGPSLQPGQKYSWQIAWEILDPKNPSRKIVREEMPRTFQVLDKSTRESLLSDLNALTVRLQSNGFSGEDLVLERAKYFADRQLWSDALQELYTFSSNQKTQSFESLEAFREITNYLCPADS